LFEAVSAPGGCSGGNPRTARISYGVDFPPLPSIQVAGLAGDYCDMETADQMLYVYTANMTMNRSWKTMTPIRYQCDDGYHDEINEGYGPLWCLFNGRRILACCSTDWGNLDNSRCAWDASASLITDSITLSNSNEAPSSLATAV
jgi:hypothetical protein